MSSETLEFLKWVVGVPTALVVLITIPFVFRKQQLELRKLQLEIARLRGESAAEPQGKPKKNQVWIVSFMEWIAPYWLPLAFFQMFVLIGVSLWKRDPNAFGVGIGLLLLMLLAGSMLNDIYGPFDLKRRR